MRLFFFLSLLRNNSFIIGHQVNMFCCRLLFYVLQQWIALSLLYQNAGSHRATLHVYRCIPSHLHDSHLFLPSPPRPCAFSFRTPPPALRSISFVLLAKRESQFFDCGTTIKDFAWWRWLHVPLSYIPASWFFLFNRYQVGRKEKEYNSTRERSILSQFFGTISWHLQRKYYFSRHFEYCRSCCKSFGGLLSSPPPPPPHLCIKTALNESRN